MMTGRSFGKNRKEVDKARNKEKLGKLAKYYTYIYDI